MAMPTSDVVDPESQERFVTVPGGRVFVRDTGGTGPAIVLMHGFPDNHRIYDNLTPHMSPMRAVAFDFLGYGKSDRIERQKINTADHVAEVDAVLDDLGIRDVILLGHDASGPDAVAFAQKYPERVSRVVLLNTTYGFRSALRLPEMTRLFSEPELSSLTDDLMSDVNQRLWILQRWGVQWELDATDQSGLAARSIIPQFFGGADQPDALVGIRNWTDGWLESLKQQDALVESGSLREFQTPVSVVFGENDPYLTPTLAAELASLFSGATIDIISGAGHYPQEDQPKAVADLLKRFI